MERFWLKKSWPADLSYEVKYRLGERPLHEYLRGNAKEAPDKVAYIFYDREITWKQLDQYSDSIANFLLSKGTKKGDRVALFMQNCPQYIIAHFAVQKIGAVVGTASPMFKEWELEYEVNDLGAEVIFTTDDLYPTVFNILGKTPLKHVVLSNYNDFAPGVPTVPFPQELKNEKTYYPNTYDMMQLLNDFKPAGPHVDIDIWEDVALMVYTSGTTGRPKGAMLTYGNALFKAAAYYNSNGLAVNDIFLASSPIFHIAGMVMGINMPVYGANKTVLLTRFEPEAAITAVEKYRCTMWHSIVPMNLAILNYPGIEKRDLSSLRCNLGTSFGIALTEDVSQAWKKLTGGCLLYEAAYGLSETHTCDTFMPPAKIRFGSCGIPINETDVRIVDPDTGQDLEPGQQGEIAIKNRGVFKGYWNNPEGTRKTLRDGWVFTGDMGYIDEDGFLYFNGRLKEMIKCSGYSVFPEDVEVLLLKHPAVSQVAVTGVPDPVRGESVKAFIVLKPDYKGKVAPEEIIDWSRNHMAAYKYPRHVEFRDSLPTTGTGKLLRRLLKEGE
ncbi:MAG: AMP-binding protein [Bacillota bacterium]